MTNESLANKSKEVVSFRLQEDQMKAFEAYTTMLGIVPSKLARLAFLRGIDIAVQEIVKERQAGLSRVMEVKMVRGTGFEPVTPTVSKGSSILPLAELEKVMFNDAIKDNHVVPNGFGVPPLDGDTTGCAVCEHANDPALCGRCLRQGGK